MTRKTALTATALVASLVLVGCGSGKPSTVNGLRDDLNTKPAVSERSHYKTEAKTKRVCVSRKKNGSCKSYADKPDGFKRVKVIDRKAQDALYCVELDDVNGSKKDDDVWYTVTWATYHKAAAKDEGDRIKKMPYKHTGCWR